MTYPSSLKDVCTKGRIFLYFELMGCLNSIIKGDSEFVNLDFFDVFIHYDKVWSFCSDNNIWWYCATTWCLFVWEVSVNFNVFNVFIFQSCIKVVENVVMSPRVTPFIKKCFATIKDMLSGFNSITVMAFVLCSFAPLLKQKEKCDRCDVGLFV